MKQTGHCIVQNQSKNLIKLLRLPVAEAFLKVFSNILLDLMVPLLETEI